MPSINLKGTTLSYEVKDTGKAIVFLHAGIADMHMWDSQYEYCAANHLVVRYDQRGYGLTPFGVDEFAYAEDLRALMDHLNIQRAVLVGCSLGEW